MEVATVGRVQRTDLVVVRVVPTRIWHALIDDEVAGKAHVVRRPDGLYLVAIDAWLDEVFDTLLGAVRRDLPHDLSTLVGETDEGERDRWTRHGFEERRREDEYELRPGGAVPAVPEGYRLVPASDVDVDELRHLDDDLRRDAPGMRGWVNDPDLFADQMRRSPVSDPSPSLVAVEADSGNHVGLAHVRVAPRWARLGFVGVRPGHRRRGLGRALVGGALLQLNARGVGLVLAEADAGNGPARALLTGFGARRTGGTIELTRPARSG